MGSTYLDYTIEIPELNAQGGGSSLDLGSIESGQNQPVVILLGWGGCSDKNLSKYSAIYANRGCTVIRYTAPWPSVFFSESLGIPALRTPAKKLLELLFDYEIEKKPVLFHVFSNGGAMLYRYIAELIHSHRQFSHLQVAGTIFDSAPGRQNLPGAVRALSSVLAPRNAALRLLLLCAFVVVVAVFRILLYPATRYVHASHYDALRAEASRWPELYLYSKADRIILAGDVEAMVRARLDRRVLVRAVDFTSSAHVQHFREYPTYYASLCLSFMRDCVGG
ncbi:transmembrane protein 53 [Tachyglossus aculeatus]|uniref:transmembrane protein 53 n=1 Tax=Tachyglossus aculeatus TaxID=9261 RepID=UPI0018F5B1E7|nr:transmembrane protein 53 [Tachyglossus aculeatus]